MAYVEVRTHSKHQSQKQRQDIVLPATLVIEVGNDDGGGRRITIDVNRDGELTVGKPIFRAE